MSRAERNGQSRFVPFRPIFWQSYVSRALGIISRNGRNISFREVSIKARSTYNFSPTVCLFVPRYMARILNRPYSTGRFDLSDIGAHNGFEHNASLLRVLSIKPIQFLTNPASPLT
jgi:Peroxidase, family 2